MFLFMLIIIFLLLLFPEVGLGLEAFGNLLGCIVD